MAAMRLYTVEELETALKDFGCKKTDETSGSHALWRLGDGSGFTVPKPDKLSGKYSDFVYEAILGYVRISSMVKTH